MLVLTLFGIETSDDELDLPYIYLIPKMHKNPYKHRFIAIQHSVPQTLYPFFLQNCLHILSKVFRSIVKQPTQEVGLIRCESF